MSCQHHVIYVPGILDDYLYQSQAVKLWRLYGVHGHCHVMPWAGDEAYEPKHRRLLEAIDSHRSRGHTVSLFGASAGASAVINAYVERRDDVAGLVYVVGKILAPETVSDKVYAKNPAFRTSMELLQANLSRLTAADKARMHSFYSPADGYVPHAGTVIDGVAESQLPALRHGWAITYSLTLGAPTIIRRLKRIASSHPASH